MVTKLDRLGRTVKTLVELIHDFRKRKIHFKCLNDPVDTTSASGEFFFHIMAAFSELERSLIRERTRAGLESARARGRSGGRPSSISNEKKEMAYQMYMENKDPLTTIAKELGISRMSVYRYIEKRKASHATTAQTK